MSQPSNDHPYETARLVARLAGEEGPDHPRQISARWLEASGYGAKVGRFDQAYHQNMRGFSTDHIATFAALQCVLGDGEAQSVYPQHIRQGSEGGGERLVDAISYAYP